jgi:hypothetical protein
MHGVLAAVVALHQLLVLNLGVPIKTVTKMILSSPLYSASRLSASKITSYLVIKCCLWQTNASSAGNIQAQ